MRLPNHLDCSTEVLFAKAFLFTPGRTRGFVMPKGNKNFRPPFIKGGEKSKRAASFWPLSAESGILYTPNTRERVRKQPGGLFSRGNPRLGFPLKDFHIYILPNIHILIFPLKNQRWDAAGTKQKNFFSYKKFFSLQSSPGRLQIHFSKMRLSGWGFRSLRRAARGYAPLNLHQRD